MRTTIATRFLDGGDLGCGESKGSPKRDKKAIALILQKKLVKEGGGKMGGDNARRGQIPLKDGRLRK